MDILSSFTCPFVVPNLVLWNTEEKNGLNTYFKLLSSLSNVFWSPFIVKNKIK